MRSKISKLVILNFILLIVLFPFQNCSNKINSDLVSETINSSLSTVEPEPVIAFVEKTNLYSTRDIVSNFTINGVDTLMIKSIRCQLTSQLENQAAQDCSNQRTQSNNLNDGDYILKVIVEMVSGNIFEVSRYFRVAVTPLPPTGTMKTIFIASGHGARTVMSCDDGVTWINDRKDAGALDDDHSTTASRGIDSGGGYLFANFGWGYNGTLRRSRDGVNWDIVHDGSWGGGIAVSKNLILHVTEGQNWYTSNSVGASWTRLVSSNINSVNTLISYPAVTKLNNKIFVTGRNSALGISYDEGTTWTVIPNAYTANSEGRSFAEGNGIIISQSFLRATVTTSETAGIIRSTDNGKTWATYPLPFSLGKLHFNGSQFVSISSAKVWKSSDGINWTSKPILVDGIAVPRWWSIVSQYNSKTGTYVGILRVYGRTGALQFAYRSVDGENWITLDSTKYTGGFTIHTIAVSEIESKYCP